MSSLLMKRFTVLPSSLVTPSFIKAPSSFLSKNFPSVYNKLPSFSNNNFQIPSSQQRLFTTTSSKMSSGSTQFLEILKQRRTIYALKAESTISDKKIQEIVSEALLHVPSSFNTQTTRIVILLKDEHTKLWDIAKETLKGILPAERYKVTEKRLSGFQNAYGSILFFDDRNAIAEAQNKFASFAESLPGWATQSDAMTQYVPSVFSPISCSHFFFRRY